MKKITLILLFILSCSSIGHAQVAAYGFAQSNETYTEITGGTVLGTSTTATSFDSQLWAIPDGSIPFNFNFNGTDYTGCSVNSNGYITFGTTLSSAFTSTPISSTTAYSGAVSAWGGDLCGVFVSGLITGETRWEVVGTAPNREFVIQFKNWRPTYTSSITNIPYINFQIKLVETSNVVKVVYGLNGYAAGSTAASGTRQIGLRGATNTDYNNRLNNASTLFTASTSGIANNSSQAYNTVVATPGLFTNGLTYAWTPPVPCTGTPVAGTSSPVSQTLPFGQVPAALSVSGQTTGVSGLTYQWEESTDGGTNWVNASGGTGVTTLSYLPPAYAGSPIQYRLKITCTASGLFNYSTVASLVSCPANAVPATENFATYVPGCWIEADNGDATAGPSTFGTSSWAVDGFSNSGATGAMKINIDATGDNDWILSPLYSIPATGYELKFDAAVTQWNGTGAPTTPWESDDFVEVLVSTGTTNWTVLYTYNDTNAPAFSGSTNIIDLDAYSGQNVRFAFRGVEGAANGGADIDFFVDNFEIRLTPACANPIGLGVNSITDTSANISWAASTGNYEYVLDQVVTDPAGSGTTWSSETFNATPLVSTTTYYFHVRTVCAGPIYSVWSTISFTTLATPPANDNCSGAVVLTAGGVFGDNPVTGTNLGASDSTPPAPGCASFAGGDVWYSVTIPASGTLTIETNNNTAGGSAITDTGMAVYSGGCATLVLVECDDDDSLDGNFSLISLTARTPGEVLFINVWEYAGGTIGTFKISAYDASLGTGSFDAASFKAYPNPVKDVLHVSYSTEISSVEIYNMLGQNVLTKTLDVAQGQVDMSNLNAGSYIVKVTADGLTQTIKVVKQ